MKSQDASHIKNDATACLTPEAPHGSTIGHHQGRQILPDSVVPSLVTQFMKGTITNRSPTSSCNVIQPLQISDLPACKLQKLIYCTWGGGINPLPHRIFTQLFQRLAQAFFRTTADSHSGTMANQSAGR